MYLVWHCVKGFAERSTDVRGFVKDNLSACMHLVKFCIDEAMAFDFTPKGQRYDRLLDPNSTPNRLLRCLTVENMEAIGRAIAGMSPEERSNAIGRMIADMVLTSVALRGVSATTKLTRNMVTLHAEGKLAQSIEQTAQSFTSKVKNLIPAAEEAVAVTAEGVSVRVATAAEETMSLQQTTQKVGGAAQKAEGLLVGVAEQAVVKNLVDSFIATARQDIPRLKQIFDGKFKGFGDFANKFLKFDYEHILGMELEFTRRGVPKIKGFHHDFMGTVEKSGVLEFANKKILENGFYKAEVCNGPHFLDNN